MICKPLTPPLALLAFGCLSAIGQQPATRGVFTPAQAAAGRVAYEQSCGRCHTYSLRGRKGEEGELPPASSLPAPYLKFIGPAMRVPPLMGKAFVGKYGEKTTAELFTLFRGAADTTPVAELHMSDDTLVSITAYILQMNGGKAGDQPLTKTTNTAFQSLVE